MKSNMKRSALVFFGILSLINCSPVLRNPGKSTVDDNENSVDICTTKECIGASYRFLKSMNDSVDPCENFYEFSCGRFLEDTIIPDDKSSWTSFEPIEEDIFFQGRTLLEAEQSEDDFDSYKLARDHYKACINEEKLEELGVEPMQRKLKEFGGWPVVEGDKWKSENFSVWDWTLRMNAEGFGKDHLIDFDVGPDDKNSTSRIIEIDQADLGMSREYLIKGFEDKDVQHYFRYMVDTAILFGAKPEDAKRELKDSLLFEIELAFTTAAREDRRNSTQLYNPTTAGEAKTHEGLPSSWTEFCRKMFKDATAIKIDEDEKINIASPEYLENLGKLITKTDKRTLANYLAWRAIKPFMTLLNEEARKIRQRYRKALLGIQVETPTWKRCVEEIGFNNFDSSNFIYVASSMYVKKYFKPEAKKEMIELTDYIRKAFEDIVLPSIDWMDEKVKEKAKKKLAEMDQFIAYSDEFLNKEKIDELYQGLEISENDLFGNSLKIYRFWRTFIYNRLREKIDRTSWIEHNYIALVNALYYPENNYMEFPAGILQGSFFAPNVPKYVNFGSIGVVIGHEITHGFDDEGKQRNELGEIDNWWDSDTEESYKKKAQCMIDQYSSFTAKQVDMKIDGVNNIGENIADNGGIKEAYHAYLRWVSDNKEELPLAGLPYSSRQMFWISYSQLWCAKYQDSALKELILTDYHSPGEFRVIGPLSNNEDFARDFNCPLGSNMNPVDKCSVW